MKGLGAGRIIVMILLAATVSIAFTLSSSLLVTVFDTAWIRRNLFILIAVMVLSAIALAATARASARESSTSTASKRQVRLSNEPNPIANWALVAGLLGVTVLPVMSPFAIAWGAAARSRVQLAYYRYNELLGGYSAGTAGLVLGWVGQLVLAVELAFYAFNVLGRLGLLSR